MKSATAKVLHPVAGLPMLAHAIAAASGPDPAQLVVVVRHERAAVAGYVEENFPHAVIADQDELPGTGRAVQCALEELERRGTADPDAVVVITLGDAPLLTAETITALVDRHVESGAAGTLLTAVFDNPFGYGRVVREGDTVVRIVEEKDADEQQRAIREINTGVYAVRLGVLRDALAQVGTDNAQGEMYLTDIPAIIAAGGGRVLAHTAADPHETDGVNDRVQLSQAGQALNRRICERWMRAGVTIVDPATTWIDTAVVLEPDATLLPGVQLHGATVVQGGAVVGPDSTLTDVTVEAGAQVVRTVAVGAHVGAGATVGPFTYLRPGTRLGVGAKAGGFVETKNAVIGDGSKVPHLSYVGDAEIGRDSNIGAATVFVNYDGVNKHRSRVGDNVRIGSDTMLVAPVTIGDGAFTAAGSVVRKDVPPGALAMSVAPQRNREGWVLEKRAGSASAQAARRALEDPPTSSDSDRPVST